MGIYPVEDSDSEAMPWKCHWAIVAVVVVVGAAFVYLDKIIGFAEGVLGR